MQRDIFSADHRSYRDLVSTFIAKEISPEYSRWESAGVVDRSVWLAAGRQGLLGVDMPEKYGGGGNPDYRFHAVLAEELARAGVYAPAFPLHNEVVGQYLLSLATPEQRERWFPGFCSGELIGAIAITEPGAGSDLQGLRTTATLRGDRHILNGQKTFISNGSLADLVLVVAKAHPGGSATKATMLVLERGMPGFERGSKLDKIGMLALDTLEMFFHEVEVPTANVLGQPGRAFSYLMRNLVRERTWIAVSAIAAAERVFEDTLAYCRQRRVFGQPIGHHQANKFLIAELATQLAVARAFTDRCIAEHDAGRLVAEEAAMAKWWNTELAQRVVDRCVQLHGGYGFLRGFAVARAYLDIRVQTLYGGSTEVMKEMIGHALT